MNIHIANILFDLDGTLTDPGEGFVACIRHALARVGAPRLPRSEIRKHIGPPLQDTLKRLLGDDARVWDAVGFYRERYASEGLLETHLYPGITAALEQLGKGAALFLATSKPRVFAERILRHYGLERFFSGIYGSELDGTRSHKRELIAHLLERESLDPAASVMVGDRAQDMAGARANGVRAVGVLWGYGSPEELGAAGASWLCATPRELTRLARTRR